MWTLKGSVAGIIVVYSRLTVVFSYWIHVPRYLKFDTRMWGDVGHETSCSNVLFLWALCLVEQ